MTSAPQTPKMNTLFRLQFEKAQGCFVLLYPEGMVKLNDSAAEILQHIDGLTSVDEIQSQLQKKFPQADDIRCDIEEFLAAAQAKRWISYV
ncbi:pyrroloquinoline quinone biosynthesis peptide chaperone PqqD [Shewanella sp. D64]|uniref:pyrroloquinoline quinone biosynthesis peptide chaperone PqqD n=1 Tax=unclassified Shewanella TaxID=196818 RepID=UPI0022BA6AEA|nr:MULTISPECIES: pyrroloquinoline quinone biosynthesis peptide chaperone PqqD [unclassified Shewanella]MEC4724152.1 pyrroloquinoline quinone biosynthesis peptide chaperone PqqD [Shewanella sp. D64]MEC4736172.1 pyrroloquinoline quinone biosynthesis peptide chaperone PqqD [Shewanella sp. E94]WBJ97892.1 pyrroloquinoline quinone biosynthesis peptide chaperone PqqD [Shewanella sp. MTB7]